MNVEYDGGTNHYQLWKPPNGCFPRGEAPPPYEEAVALAQAEAMNSQQQQHTCTVSVATTTHHHRTLPLSICAENPDLHSCSNTNTLTNPNSNITTNLINININNAGTLTALATGENHQISSPAINNTNTNTPQQQQQQQQQYQNLMTSMTTSNQNLNMPQPHHHHSHNHQPGDGQSYRYGGNNGGSALNHHYHHHHNPSSIQTIPNQTQFGTNSANCLVMRLDTDRQQDYCPYPSDMSEMGPNQQTASSNEVLVQNSGFMNNLRMPEAAINDSNAENQENVTYFNHDLGYEQEQPFVRNSVKHSSAKGADEGANVELNFLSLDRQAESHRSTSRDSKYHSSSSRRLHRTIPRHFTTTTTPQGVETTIATGFGPSSSSNLKKPSESTSSSSTLKRQLKQCDKSGQNNKKPICQCPIQHVPMTYMGTTSLNSNNLLASNVTGPTKLVSNHHHKSMLNVAKLSQQVNNQVDQAAGKSYESEEVKITNSLRRIHKPKLVLDISEASKNETGLNPVKIQTISKQVLNSEKETSNETAKHHSQSTAHQEHHIQSILKQNPPHKSSKSSSSKETDLINPPPFPIQLIDSINKSQYESQPAANPALPPKKHRSSSSHQMTAQTSSNIHTISKPSSSSMSSRVNYGNDAANIYSKSSLPRPEDSKLMIFPNSEKTVPKISNSFPSSANHITYSLPKSGHVSKSNSSRSSISDVLSKVPSVINMPSPSTLQTQPQSAQSGSKPNAALQNPSPSTSAQPSTSRSHCHEPRHHSQTNQPKTSSSTTNAQLLAKREKPQAENDKPLPVCTTSKNCSNPKEHFLPNDTSLDDDYLSECENCKSAHGSRYYLDEEVPESPQETMTLQRKMPETENEEQAYYRTSSTLPTNTKQKTTTIKSREPWFSSIPASSSSEEETNE